MIKEIQIKNFQSHNNSILELNKNINSIIGSSNQGKTAVLRALLWVLTNRPRGDAFISHWAVDKNEKQIKPTSVKIITDKGNIERRKDSNFNGYIINDIDKYEALKGNIPEEINKIIKVDDVNIQRQLDAPFLISNTSGEVARFFNKTIKLDVIDIVLSEVDSMRRKTKKELTTEKEIKEQIEKDLNKLDWIENAEKLINRARILNNRLSDLQNKSRDFSISTTEYRNKRKILKEFNWIDNTEKLYIEYDKLENEIDKLHDKATDFTSIVFLYKEQQNIYEQGVPDIGNYIVKINDLDQKIDLSRKNIRLFEEMIKYWKENQEILVRSEKKIQELKQELPARCPVCNSILKERKE